MTGGRPGRIRVLFPEHSALIGGGQTYLISLLRNLDRDRFEPLATVVTPGEMKSALTGLGVHTEVIDMRRVLRKSPLATMENFRDFYRLIKSRRVDVIHCNSQKSLLVAGPPARAAGALVIWHCHLPAGFGRVFDMAGLALAHVVVVNTEHVRRRFGIGSHKARKMRVVPFGIDVDRFSKHRDTGATRAALGLATSDTVIGYVGRVAQEKGTHILVEAVPGIVERVASAKFLIVGEVSDEQADFKEMISDRARDLGVSEKIVFTGFRDDIPDLIAAMDIVVVPSLREAFGQVNVEAMAAGRPLVASRVGGIPEVVEDGVTGLLVPPGDSVALAGAVAGLLGDPAASRRMGEAGRRRAFEVFDIRKHVRLMESIYAEMVGQYGPGE